MWSGDSVEPIEAQVEVVCDAGPLIHLDELGSLDLLADFAEVLVPESVCEEVERHRPGCLERVTFPIVRQASEIWLPPDLQVLVKTLSLGAGEQAALASMAIHPRAVFLSDDAAARVAAKALHYRSQGTIGVILRSLRRGRRSRPEVLSLLLEIPTRSTLHIRPALLQEVIEEVQGEAPV
jgi:predicted nucleic acid-binding protein